MHVSKNVQISRELFVLLCRYHLCDDVDTAVEIEKQLKSKYDAIIRRESYAKYKTATDANEREKARNEYLDLRGIPDSYRY